jgi:hypothetical protein
MSIEGECHLHKISDTFCYGDIGNGFAFLNARKFFKDNEVYKENYTEIFNSLSFRTDAKDQLINDSGVCHGSSGINAICNSLINVFKFEIQVNLVDHWQDVSLGYYYRGPLFLDRKIC